MLTNLLVLLGVLAVTLLCGPWWGLGLLSVCVVMNMACDWIDDRAEARADRKWREELVAERLRRLTK